MWTCICLRHSISANCRQRTGKRLFQSVNTQPGLHEVLHGSRQGPVLITGHMVPVESSLLCQEPTLLCKIVELKLLAEAVPLNKHPVAAARADGHVCSKMLKLTVCTLPPLTFSPAQFLLLQPARVWMQTAAMLKLLLEALLLLPAPQGWQMRLLPLSPSAAPD